MIEASPIHFSQAQVGVQPNATDSVPRFSYIGVRGNECNTNCPLISGMTFDGAWLAA
jgi:hypothetical protein